LKILQVCPGVYFSGRGGVSEHVVRISEALVKLGHDVTVYATNSGELPYVEIKNGVKVKRFPRIAPGVAYFFSPAMFFSLASADFDVVHAHNFNALPMHFALLAKCKKFVVTAHFHGSGHSVFRDCLFKIFRIFGKRTLLKANTVVAVSEYEKKLLMQQFNFKENKVTVVPNGLNFEEFQGLEKHEKGSRCILFVGRLEEYKGVQYLIEVLPHLDSDIVLEIVGRGPFRDALKNLAEQLDVADRVFFFQDVPRIELLQKYFDSDVFVLLSKHEAYGLVVAEALVSGTPCIVADASALSEWIDNRHCFGLKLPITLDVLAKLIDKTINDKVIHGPSKTSDKIISWTNVALQLERAYGGRNSC
jgi:glycosyltransferase involved in cell wall biosynthesis